MKVVDQIRLRRIRTNDTLLLMGIQFFFERIKRGIKNATVRHEMKLREREYYDYWNQVHQQQIQEYGYILDY